MRKRSLLRDLVQSLCWDIKANRLQGPEFSIENRAKEIWKQKVFCILSSQFRADRAATISQTMLAEVPFFDETLSLQTIEAACFSFLNNPAMRHRFPAMRARQIALSWFPFAQIKEEYHQFVCSFGSEDKARQEITSIFPGIGLKQASMFLRNIGASKTLSVIDVHVLSYLHICHGWNVEQLTRSRYLRAEEILRRDAEQYDVELNVFDAVVWTAARTLKKVRPHV